MNKIKAELLSLEKKLRACPDSKQKVIDKDIFNLLVTMTKRIEELEKEVEELRKPAIQDIYTWRDIVKINDKIYTEKFPISGKKDHINNRTIYEIDDFLEAVAKKYGVDVDDVETYMMDDIEFDARELPYGAESCGCYINGVPEWVLDIDRKESED